MNLISTMRHFKSLSVLPMASETDNLYLMGNLHRRNKMQTVKDSHWVLMRLVLHQTKLSSVNLVIRQLFLNAAFKKCKPFRIILPAMACETNHQYLTGSLQYLNKMQEVKEREMQDRLETSTLLSIMAFFEPMNKTWSWSKWENGAVRFWESLGWGTVEGVGGDGRCKAPNARTPSTTAPVTQLAWAAINDLSLLSSTTDTHSPPDYTHHPSTHAQFLSHRHFPRLGFVMSAESAPKISLHVPVPGCWCFLSGNQYSSFVLFCFFCLFVALFLFCFLFVVVLFIYLFIFFFFCFRTKK